MNEEMIPCDSCRSIINPKDLFTGRACDEISYYGTLCPGCLREIKNREDRETEEVVSEIRRLFTDDDENIRSICRNHLDLIISQIRDHKHPSSIASFVHSLWKLNIKTNE